MPSCFPLCNIYIYIYIYIYIFTLFDLLYYKSQMFSWVALKGTLTDKPQVATHQCKLSDMCLCQAHRGWHMRKSPRRSNSGHFCRHVCFLRMEQPEDRLLHSGRHTVLHVRQHWLNHLGWWFPGSFWRSRAGPVQHSWCPDMLLLWIPVSS